jgi:excisionase family DNA binding protein
MNHGQEKLVLTVDEACAALSISRASLYRLFRQKKLKVVRIGKITRVRFEELVRFIKASERL